eukprot:TRINITY_DN77922_c0_g1_i1.p1 TRINITY_DN77922_c0_g1~~TRINITY_DN77922_c0_g1_i1.p1  ORF type:complete len:2254 (-),score=410.37 TRINITY_DN77922_c0_g1_i1:43-6741(-)
MQHGAVAWSGWSCGSLLSILLLCLEVIGDPEGCDGNATERRLLELTPGHVIAGERSRSVAGDVGAILAAVYSEEKDYIFVGGVLGGVSAYQGSTMDYVMGGFVSQSVTSVAYMSGKKLLAVGQADGRVTYMTASGLAVMDEESENSASSAINSMAYITYSDDVGSYKELASCSGTSSRIRLWKEVDRKLSRELVGHESSVQVICFLKELQMLASGAFDGYVGIWTLPMASLQAVGKRCEGSSLLLLGTAYTPESCLEFALQAAGQSGGEYFVHGLTGTIAENDCQMLVDVGNCDGLMDAAYTMYRIITPLKHMIRAHGAAVRALVSVPEQGGLVASSGNDGRLRLWSPNSGKLVRELASTNQAIEGLAYVSSLRTLVAATTNEIVYFDVAQTSTLKIITRETTSPALVFALDAWGTIVSTQGLELEEWPQIQRCENGTRPGSPGECFLCPRGRIGMNGFCQTECESGSTGNANGTVCILCKQGQAGSKGFCDDCEPGRFQDQPGKFICKRCAKGTAQSRTGQSSCERCIDNTAAEQIGMTNCEECTDGTEPLPDHTRCDKCAEGTAGKQGICFPCSDGEQASDDSSMCVPCGEGTAGTKGLCVICLDGTQPDSTRTTCNQCPVAFAGTGGICSRCKPGEQPAPGSAFCMACSPGTAGLNGTCQMCPSGFVQSPNRTVCLPCPDGQVAVVNTASCAVCQDGTEPAPNRSVCLPCPPGYAGTEGLCEMCPNGTRAGDDKTRCEDCAEGYFGTRGFCTICEDGTEPDKVDGSTCEPCPLSLAGKNGSCQKCEAGRQQSSDRSFCERCPVGKAGTGGICEFCYWPEQQTPNATSCEMQPVVPYFLHTFSRCGAHPTCRAHFEHQDYDNLYCCPTPSGVSLKCCDFEDEFSMTTGKGLALVLDAVLIPLSRMPWLLAFVTVIIQSCVQIYFRRIRTSDSWAEWRDSLRFSIPALVMAGCIIFLQALALPWVLIIGFVIMLPAVPLSGAAFGGYHNIMLRILDGVEPMSRSKATKRKRVWLFATADAFMTGLVFMTEWATTRFLTADLMAAAAVLRGGSTVQDYIDAMTSAPVRPCSYAFVINSMALPSWMLWWAETAVSLSWAPQVAVSNLAVRVGVYSSTPASCVVVAASLAYSTIIFSYMILAADLPARVAATKQAVIVSTLPFFKQSWRLFVLGGLETILSVMMRAAAVAPARMVPLIIMILAVPPPEGAWWEVKSDADARVEPDPLGLTFALVSAAAAQVVFICVWVWLVGGHRQSTHLGNPPQPLARYLIRAARDPLLYFEDYRQEEYLLCAVLRTLGLKSKDSYSDDELPASEENSPREGSSPRSPGASTRSPHGSARPPQSPHNHAGMSSPHAAGASSGMISSRGVKLKKHLGSVKHLLRHAAGMGSRGNSPTSSPRSPEASPRSPQGTSAIQTARQAKSQGPRFVRLADGSHIDLSLVKKYGGATSRSQTARSPTGTGVSPRGTANSPREGRLNQRGTRMAGWTGAEDAEAEDEDEEDQEEGDGRTARPKAGAGNLETETHARRSCGQRLRRCWRAVDAVLKIFCRCTRLRRYFVRFFPKKHEMKSGFKRRGKLWLEVPEHKRKSAQSFIDIWEAIVELDGTLVDITKLQVMPRPLFNAVPRTPVNIHLRQPFLRFYDSLKVAAWTVIGCWKEEFNTGPLRVRLRCRELVKETGRSYIDQEDYNTIQRSSANSVANCLLLMPGGAFVSEMCRYTNSPALRNFDSTLDIMKHKIEENVDKGVPRKEAELQLRRYLASGHAGDRSKFNRLSTLARLQKILSLVIVGCLAILSSPLANGKNAEWAAPLFFSIAWICAIVTTYLERVIIPLMSPSREAMVSVKREVKEEISVMEKVLDTFRNMDKEESESSESEDNSTEYSSANESFLDEDPQSRANPNVLGARKLKIIVRPRRHRTLMRFNLLRAREEMGTHAQRWAREDVFKYGRLMRVPGLLPPLKRPKPVQLGAAKHDKYMAVDARKKMEQGLKIKQPKSAFRDLRSYCFSPTEESDAQFKEEVHGLKRSASLGTGFSCEQKCEERSVKDHWGAHADVFMESYRGGMPKMPAVLDRMPPRGLIDEFEARESFMPQPRKKNLKELALGGLITDTRIGDRVLRQFNDVTSALGLDRVQKRDPWQEGVDEALGEGVFVPEIKDLIQERSNTNLERSNVKKKKRKGKQGSSEMSGSMSESLTASAAQLAVSSQGESQGESPAESSEMDKAAPRALGTKGVRFN